MWSSEILHILAAQNCYLLWEKSWPDGRLKRDFISIKTDDGRDLEYRTPEGMHACPIQVPRETLDDFMRASFVRQDGADDDEGRAIFRLTVDGKIRGHDRSSALRELAKYVEENADASSPNTHRSLDPSEREAMRIRILDVAADLESLSRIPLSEPLPYSRFEPLLGRLHAEGFYPLEWQVGAVAHAIHRAGG